MAGSRDRLPWLVSIGICVLWAVAPATMSRATSADTIRIWKIGSPHRGDTPAATVPLGFRLKASRLGFQIAVEAFPAKGFAAIFFDAAARNAAPDLLVSDNHGVIEGITTALGRFEGIGEEPSMRRDLLWVKGGFEELLGPQRGWTYLFSASPNHAAVRALALRKPECPSGSAGSMLQGTLAHIVADVATSYLERDLVALQAHADPDRLSGIPARPDALHVRELGACRVYGNDRLAFVPVNASYEADTTLGHAAVVLVFRKRSPQSPWQLLAAARDPISTTEFAQQAAKMAQRLVNADGTSPLLTTATLLSRDGEVPQPSLPHERFGNFTWRSSPSDDVIAEIVEFSYHDDARLFVMAPRAAETSQISAGRLWTTRSIWSWRIWSISRTGDVVFSDTRTFPH